jgi:hypothetical protein
MTSDDIGRLFAEAERRFDQAAINAAKTDQAIARADSVIARVGERSTAEREAARRERQRLNAGFGRSVKRVLATIAALWIATMVFGFFRPIGLFGLLTVVAVGFLVVLLVAASSRQARAPRPIPSNLPPAQLADRLDSYLYRARPALPPPAQAEVDLMLAALPALRPTLEEAGALDPATDDARRLMATHLPGLLDRYLAVPPAFRARREGDEPSVDDRLVEALKAGRGALDDIGERLARDNVAAFETQGRFIESRYKDESVDP